MDAGDIIKARQAAAAKYMPPQNATYQSVTATNTVLYSSECNTAPNINSQIFKCNTCEPGCCKHISYYTSPQPVTKIYPSFTVVIPNNAY